jgi:uncharacterized membrane-anchored protein YhcB (DUF1043 family)
MFGDISVWTWMGATIMFAMGGAAGYFIARQFKDKRTLELEEKLEATRNELSQYQGDVNQHFLKTSLLLTKLTNNYREVYEHLATGAQKLCNNKPGTPKLDLPDTKILPTAEIPDDEQPALERVTDTPLEAQSDIAQASEPDLESAKQENADIQADVTREATVAEEQADATKQESVEQQAQQPAPEDIPARDEPDEDVPLGAESAPSVDTELHKTHPSIH